MSPDGSVRPATSADLGALAALARSSAWAPLRYLALFGHDVGGHVLAERVVEAVSGPGLHLTTGETGAEVVDAHVSIVPVGDLEEHFRVPVYEVAGLLTAFDGAARRQAVERLLDHGLSVIDARGTASLVMCRIEADDEQALLGAEAVGFRVLETTLTFVSDLLRADRNPPPPAGEVRVIQLGVDRLDPELFDPLRGQAAQVSDSHYHRDPRLSDERCDDLYERLFERALDGVGADVVVMRMHEGRIAALGTWRRWRELEPFGVSMVGSSFGFRVADAPPGTQSVVSHVTGAAIAENRLLEWSTQASNYPMVNMICHQPSMRLCRTSYVLHCWSDRRWD